MIGISSHLPDGQGHPGSIQGLGGIPRPREPGGRTNTDFEKMLYG